MTKKRSVKYIETCLRSALPDYMRMMCSSDEEIDQLTKSWLKDQGHDWRKFKKFLLVKPNKPGKKPKP